MTSYLSSAGKGVTDFGQGVGKGVGEVGKGVGRGVGEIGKGVGIGGGGEVSNADGNATTSSASEGQAQGAERNNGAQGTANPAQPAGGNTNTNTNTNGTQNQATSEGGSGGGGLRGAFNSIGGTLGTITNASMGIAGTLSKTTMDLNRNVAKGVGVIGGTAVEQVVNIASSTTDNILSPIANSLKAVEGLEALGEGVDSINGLSTQALQGIASATKKALDTAGKTPTFFDPDGDGIVKLSDTCKGFVAIGLEENYAKAAAYALHSTFSYPTSESWNPVPLIHPKSGYEFPIKIENMVKTKWGKNWGNFERVDWVQDADIERFFGLRERTTWTEYWTDVKSYFGTALLIFEWGTTWPYMSVPGSNLAAGEIGAILRTVILPTIAKTHENAEKKEGKQPKKEEMPAPPPLQEQKEEVKA
ncbi:hypothetical protein E1B28_006955 [Marasmius oreades]|uniref:EF-hand domain-containing protein n=1 Tax=Marasmius oreades TaxID=181124 RepID=A0A9P7USX9_9AGAR|nr:uncharacterized protein E1B28_006955 [Marasmius oreades]KAG7093272.1 hypothetical protein E1B28_006955 [Marasmius oreades]